MSTNFFSPSSSFSLPFLFLISLNDPALTDFLRFCSIGKEDERKVISLESGQGKERGTENRQSGIYDIFPLPFSLDTVCNRGYDRSIRQSVISTFLRKLFPILFLYFFFLFFYDVVTMTNLIVFVESF